MHKHRQTIFAAVVVSLLAPGCKEESHPAAHHAPPPNVLLITIESLRAKHLGCYGYPRDTTPNIDALASEATLFEDAQSVTSWTLTAHASLFTGLYPSAHHVTRPKDRLNDTYRTLAEILSERGYQTAAVVSGPYLRKAHNLTQGFDYYDDNPITPPDQAASRDVTNPRMETAMIRFLRERRDAKRPFFLFAYYWDPHHDYIPPEPYNKMFVPPDAEPIQKVKFNPFFKLGKQIDEAQLKYVIAQYDGEIRCTDDYLGKVWALLRELGLWDNTAIILTADHGEEFYEHGRNAHKNNLYVESLHVPLILKLPGQTKSKRDPRLVSLIDVFPTVLDLVGGETSQPQNGHSLLDAPADGPRFFELTTSWFFENRKTGEKWAENDDWVAIRKGRYKLINVQNKNRWELYDLQADPGEHHPLDPEPESKAAELRRDLDTWKKAMASLADLWSAGPQAQLSPEDEERLRSLGYLP